MQTLYDAGARNFWIHNTGPLGCLPRIIATFGKNASKLDQNQCVDSHNQAAKLFNLQLQALCVEFQQQFPEAEVTYVDVYAIKSELITNYSQYGTHTLNLHFIFRCITIVLDISLSHETPSIFECRFQRSIRSLLWIWRFAVELW